MDNNFNKLYESIMSEAKIDKEYVYEFIDYLAKKLPSKLEGLDKGDDTSFSDERVVSFYTDDEMVDKVLYVTPFFDDLKSISVEFNDEGDIITKDAGLPTSLKFSPTGDMDKDYKKYLSLIKPVLKKAKKFK